MCGIAAVVCQDASNLQSILARMTASLVHRGPDDSGIVILSQEGVGLGSRRLSIVDLDGGHQPMWDEAERNGIVFNGEIYNATVLRGELARRGHRFVTDHSDTEVAVHGFEEWGTGLFARLNGMFALAIWDRSRRRLVIARDPTGEKPLYVAKIAGGYAVASELKALFCHPGVQRTVDPVALDQYLSFGFSISPRSMLSGIEKLPAAHYGIVTARRYETVPYWSLRFSKTDACEAALVEQFDRLLDHSVKARMVADVPVGLFLSGGLDSTAIGSYMRRHTDQLHSFSIGFDERAFDESRYARLAAQALGTTHHHEVLTAEHVRELVPRLAEILDEPMADASIIPTYVVSRLARDTVKVALGGDGSDELLMGYRTYQLLKLSWALDYLPAAARRALAGFARALPARAGPIPLRGRRFLERLDRAPGERFLSCLDAYHGDARWILSRSVRSCLPASVFAEPSARLAREQQWGTGVAEQTIAAYVRTYLQEDILVKVDRASMAASLEVRAPFLDPELIDFLGTVPASLKLKGLTRKYLLRRVMRGRLPDVIIDRPKHGFGVPMASWLRTCLAPLVHEYLDPARLRAAGLFDVTAVGAIVSHHLTRGQDRADQLWPLLMFELWRERWLG